ncbi:MAG: 3-deoxy-8-phosphooctulonate synthase [Bacteroidales bacterium]|nr:3-deoxy-8-phosphooctulonate synthase [Bacteroidales bacterium]
MLYQKIKNLKETFFVIAGPCVVENENITLLIAEKLKEITQKLNLFLIFKASYKKANRTSIHSFTTIGEIEALKILEKVKTHFELPILTDIHSAEELNFAAAVVDVLQIPAFLCRQTDLLIAAGKTMLPVNIKKGQFASPITMKFALEKVYSTGNHQVLLTERGTFFGYSDLVVDFRSIPLMKSFNVPVVLDITHSLQQPNLNNGVTGGLPQYAETLAKAGIAVGVDGIFFETHIDPSKALSDGANMIEISMVEQLLFKLIKLKTALL